MLSNELLYNRRESMDFDPASVLVNFSVHLIEEIADLDFLVNERCDAFGTFFAEYSFQVQEDIDILFIAGVVFSFDQESKLGAFLCVDIFS